MKHSAYRSMQLAKENKTKKKDGNLRKWINEDWRNLTPYAENIVKSLKDTPECGKPHPKQKGKTICRPLKRLDEKTPKLASSYSKKQLKEAINLKNQGKRITWSKLKGSGIFDSIKRLKVNPYGLGYYNYCGPGTKFEGQEPVDEVDCACQDHDADYVRFRKMEKGPELKRLVREADEKLIDKADKAKINSWMGKTARFTVRNTIRAKTMAEDAGITSYDKQIGGDPKDTVEKVYSNRRPGARFYGGNASKLTGLGYALGDDDIKEVLPDAKIMDYEQLRDYNTIDELLPNNGDYVILLYEHQQNSGHWCLVMKLNNRIEFFCSYGTPPDGQLKWVDYNIRKELKSDVPHLSHLFDTCPYDVVYNDVAFQGKDESIATCGKYCVVRVLTAKDGLPLEEFEAFMKKSKPKGQTYDDYINQLFNQMT